MSIHNPFDSSIPDPFDPNQVVEDPMHGPSAILHMKLTPPMPTDGLGTYYQAGNSYQYGTSYVDALDRPVARWTIGSSMFDTSREIRAFSEWAAAFGRDGQQGLVALETTRQYARLEKRGFVITFRGSDVCGGGKAQADCATSSELLAGADEYALQTSSSEADAGRGERWTVPVWLGKICTDCSLSCSVGIQEVDGIPTGIRRVSSVKIDDTITAIQLDAARYTRNVPDSQ